MTRWSRSLKNISILALTCVVAAIVLQREAAHGVLDGVQSGWSDKNHQSHQKGNVSKHQTAQEFASLETRFLPVQQLKTYISEHSQEVLEEEWINGRFDSENRSFSVAYYWCPQRAGNIMHTFLNTIVWGMVHNRTTLWIYHNTTNQEEDCAAVLRRAQWLPSYEEWQERAQLPEPVPVSLEADTEVHPDVPVVLYPQINDVRYLDPSLWRNAWSDHPRKIQRYRNYISELPHWNQKRVQSLYAEGKEFLYGMLFSELFSLQQPTSESVFGHEMLDVDEAVQRLSPVSLALHSRHTVGADDGSYINQETKCLDELVSSESNCIVYIMSDRPKTVHLLKEYLAGVHNCSIVTANHDRGRGDTAEHGPWAGAGFLEDLDVSAHATTGVVGDPRRSSTALLIELMSHRRKIQWWKGMIDKPKTLDEVELDDIKICKLPDKDLAGYDYGPGTPTFRNHKFLDPLRTLGIVDDYMKKENQSENVTSSISLEYPEMGDIGTLLNTFVLGILTNRSLVVKTKLWNAGCSDEGRLSSRSWLEGRVEEVDWGDNFGEDSKVSSFLASDGGHVELRFGSLRYEEEDWIRLFLNFTGEALSKEQQSLLHTLYEYGPSVLYGNIFHQLLSYCPYNDTTNGLGRNARNTFVVEADSAALDDPSTLVPCVEKLIPQEDWLLDEDPSSWTCHLYVVAEGLHESANLTDELYLDNIGHACTISIYSKSEFVDIAGRPSRFFWHTIDSVSKARTGWIRPNTKSQIPVPKETNTMAEHALSLIQERLEYKRHWETWKQGRVPFEISPLAECTY